MFAVGDRVKILPGRHTISCTYHHGYGKQRLNLPNSTGTITAVNPRRGVNVTWDVPYRGMLASGFRRPIRFEYAEGPW